MRDGAHEERRLVTSLFIDVVGSTELTVKLGPERLKSALDQAFRELRAVIEREGGTVEKYIGDAIYALFGAPVAHPDDPERALRAAAGARAWSASRAADQIPFGVRVGLETGEAIIDLAAAAETKQQMSVGAVVNTAARLQQRAEPGQVLVGPVAHDATTEIATFTTLGDVDLKGLGAIAVWALDQIHATGEHRRLPFVGRDAELELLQLARRRAKTRSVLALVSGPPGQGKTRLVEEFLRQAGVRVLGARCRPGGEIGALAPLRELLLGDRPASALDDIVGQAVEEPSERERIADALAHSAGLRASAALAAIGKAEREDEIVNAWRRFVHGLAAQGPLALWVEDVHWAAPEVVRLVDRISLSGEPVLVIATARPEFAEEAGLRPSGDRFFIELEGLEPEAARELAATAGGNQDTLLRAEGNPLFIVELARARGAASDLPLTLQGALGARLDDLPPEGRTLLAHGAVIGETFAPADVAFLSGHDAVTTSHTLARLADRQYLDPVDGRYRFHHSLLRDVAYNRLLAADRLRLHARYARERADRDDVEVLAHHWWAALGHDEARWVWADDPELAAMRHAGFAAHLALGRRQTGLFAIDRAAASLDRAYALAADEAERAEAKQALGDAYADDFRGDDAWAAYADARRHFTAAGGVPALAYIGALKIRTRYGAFKRRPELAEAVALGRAAVAAARASGDREILARTLVYTAFEDMNLISGRGDPERLAEAVRLSESADPATRREVLGWHAQDLIRGLELDRAAAILDRIEAVNADTSELDRMEHERGRAELAAQRGDLADLDRRAQTLVAMSRPMGPHLRTHADLYATFAALYRGDWATLVRLGAETDQLMKASSGTAFCAAAGASLAFSALAHARVGRRDDARALLGGLDGIASERPSLDLLRAIALVFAGEGGAMDLDALLRQDPSARAALLAVITRRHDTALAIADQLEAMATGGARLLHATAEATREEVAADRGGPPPRHAALRDLGYLGWSELLSQRPGG